MFVSTAPATPVGTRVVSRADAWWGRMLATPVRRRAWEWGGPIAVTLLAAVLRLWNLGSPHTLETDETFYVGKGGGNRVLQHARDALASTNASDKLDRIRAIHAAGLEVRVVIHRHAMPEVVALEVEAALIDAYQDLTNLVSGHGALFGVGTIYILVMNGLSMLHSLYWKHSSFTVKSKYGSSAET